MGLQALECLTPRAQIGGRSGPLFRCQAAVRPCNIWTHNSYRRKQTVPYSALLQHVLLTQ